MKRSARSSRTCTLRKMAFETVLLAVVAPTVAQTIKAKTEPPPLASSEAETNQHNPANAELRPETIKRTDVLRFGRIMSLMTADRASSYRQMLPKIESLPPQLAHSLTGEEADTARLMLSWWSIWKARHAQPQIGSTLAQLSKASPTQLVAAQPGSTLGILQSRGESSHAYAKLSPAVVDSVRRLQTQVGEAASGASGAFSAARKEYESAAMDYKEGKHERSWQHIQEAMRNLNGVNERIKESNLACDEYRATLQTFGRAPANSDDLKETFEQIERGCETAAVIGSDFVPSSNFSELHFALIRLGQQVDGADTDPEVTCIDLNFTGDFLNWLWKQVRGGAGGDTNPPGWIPVPVATLSQVIQTVTGTVTHVYMEADGDIHINVGGDPSVAAVINGSDPNGEIIAEIPLCDRWWFGNLDQVGVGATIRVTGKWMMDVWNQWFELHPVYGLEIMTPAPAPGCPPMAAAATCGSQPPPWCGQSSPTVLSCPCPSGQVCQSRCSGGLCSVDWYCQTPPPTCQTTSGSCTGANGSDQCVTVSGVTQCCHSNWLYGWTPWVTACSDGSVPAQGCSGPCY